MTSTSKQTSFVLWVVKIVNYDFHCEAVINILVREMWDGDFELKTKQNNNRFKFVLVMPHMKNKLKRKSKQWDIDSQSQEE